MNELYIDQDDLTNDDKFRLLDKIIIDDYAYNAIYTVIGKTSEKSNTHYQVVAPDNYMILSVPESKLTYIGSDRLRLKSDLLAMYVLVKNTAPIGLGINACSHIGYLAARKFENRITNEWEQKSFKMITCLVTPSEFDICVNSISEVNGNYVIFREPDWNNEELSVAFEPRYTYPSIFKTLKLHPGLV